MEKGIKKKNPYSVLLIILSTLVMGFLLLPILFTFLLPLLGIDSIGLRNFMWLCGMTVYVIFMLRKRKQFIEKERKSEPVNQE